MSQLVTVIQLLFNKNEVFEDFNGFLDCHKNNYNNTEEGKPKITGEVISKYILNIVYTFNLPFDVCIGIATECSVKL